ncbi:DUF6920 family protein [Trichothermofontia sp.]
MASLTLFVLTFVSITLYGTFRWKTGTRELRDRLASSRVSIQPQIVHFDEINGLPAPVQRYFRNTLQDGQAMISAVHMRHRGTFNVGETTDEWKHFTSDQQVITQRPGFDWNGRIKILPGIPVLVHDAYISGEGILHASLFGLLSLVNLRGAGAVAEGELMRFFAEAAWYPTALLPSQGIHWEAAGDRSAQGTLTEGDISITMLFQFNEQDLIESVRAEARGRTVGSKIIPTPWYGRFWNYKEQSGMKIPLNGEVAWLLPDGEKPYWRGSLTGITYEFAR